MLTIPSVDAVDGILCSHLRHSNDKAGKLLSQALYHVRKSNFKLEFSSLAFQDKCQFRPFLSILARASQAIVKQVQIRIAFFSLLNGYTHDGKSWIMWI